MLSALRLRWWQQLPGVQAFLRLSKEIVCGGINGAFKLRNCAADLEIQCPCYFLCLQNRLLEKIFPKNQKKVLTNPRMCDRMLLQRNELIFILRITNICSVMSRQNQNGGRFYGQEGLSGELSGMRAVAVQGQP